MSSHEGYGAPPPWGETAAYAISGLSLHKEKEQRSEEGSHSPYPPPLNTLNPYAPQESLPSPIAGVVSGYPPASYESTAYKANAEHSSAPPYGAPPSQPMSYPPSAIYPGSSPHPVQGPHSVHLPENLDVLSAGKEKTKESVYTHQFYPAPNTEAGYPPAPSQSEARPPTSAVPYPQTAGHDGQGKQKKKGGGSPSLHSGPPPGGAYPPPAGPYDPSAVSVGYPLYQTAPQGPPPAGYPGQDVQLHQTAQQSPPPAGYPGQADLPGGKKSESTVSSFSEGGAVGEKGYKKNQQHGYGGGYPQPGYAQPGYPQPGYGHQPAYPQPGYEAYPSHGHAPSYPPAYPAHGYTPEAYPSHGYGAHGYAQPVAHGGHGGSHHAAAP